MPLEDLNIYYFSRYAQTRPRNALWKCIQRNRFHCRQLPTDNNVTHIQGRQTREEFFEDADG